MRCFRGSVRQTELRWTGYVDISDEEELRTLSYTRAVPVERPLRKVRRRRNTHMRSFDAPSSDCEAHGQYAEWREFTEMTLLPLQPCPREDSTFAA